MWIDILKGELKHSRNPFGGKVKQNFPPHRMFVPKFRLNVCLISFIHRKIKIELIQWRLTQLGMLNFFLSSFIFSRKEQVFVIVTERSSYWRYKRNTENKLTREVPWGERGSKGNKFSASSRLATWPRPSEKEKLPIKEPLANSVVDKMSWLLNFRFMIEDTPKWFLTLKENKTFESTADKQKILESIFCVNIAAVSSGLSLLQMQDTTSAWPTKA